MLHPLASGESPLPPQRSLAWAVFLGVAVDLGGTLVFLGYFFTYVVLGAIVSAVASGGATPPAPSFESPAVLAAGFAVGTFFSFLGGYLAACLRPDRAVLAGVLMGLSTCLVAFGPSVFFSGTFHTPPAELVAYALAFLAAVLGSALVRRRHPILHGSA
jgi:hypothetical protein